MSENSPITFTEILLSRSVELPKSHYSKYTPRKGDLNTIMFALYLVKHEKGAVPNEGLRIDIGTFITSPAESLYTEAQFPQIAIRKKWLFSIILNS